MTPEQQWWYLRELKRQTAQLENDQDRVRQLLARSLPSDRQREQRLKRELETIEIRLAKLKRGLLYG